MNITPEVESEIRSALRVLRAPIKVARKLGIDIRHILPIADEEAQYFNAAYEQKYDGWGRPELQQFAVGRKLASTPWDNEDPAIAKAREDYEAGTHDMINGRDGAWIILYSIPQKKVTPRPNYFKPEF